MAGYKYSTAVKALNDFEKSLNKRIEELEYKQSKLTLENATVENEIRNEVTAMLNMYRSAKNTISIYKGRLR